MTTAIDITLDDQHRYHDSEGRLIPGVTSLLSEVKTGYRYKADAWMLHRGSMIHRAIELAAQDKLNLPKWEADLRTELPKPHADEVLGKFTAALRFLSEHVDVEKSMQEVIVHNKMLNYAGKMDLYGYLKDGRLAVIDWKSSTDGYGKLQIGAYSLAAPKRPDVGVLVELGSNGTPRCIWGSRKPKRDSAKFDLEHAERRFVAALTFRGFLVEEKLLAERMVHVEEMYNAAQ